MALVFTDWEHYTDDDGRACTLDWTPGASGLSLRPHLEAIRQAIVERAYGALYYASLGSTLKSEVPAGDLASYSPVVSAVQTAVTALIARYANHTDSSGNWDGQTSIGPSWTASALLADIAPGTTRREQKQYGLRSAAWILQQRLILDRLLWYVFNGTTATPEASSSHQRTSGAQVDWATAVTAWDAASWTSTGAVVSHDGNLHLGQFTATRRRAALFGQMLVNVGWKAGLDVYARFQKPPGTGGTYENPDYAYAENEWARLGSTAPLAYLDTEALGTWGDFGSVTVSAPAVGAENRGWYMGSSTAYKAVCRWNVAGGFVFQP